MDITQILNTITAYKTDKEELTAIAAEVAGLTQSFINKELSESEYKELLEDIKLEGLIIADSVELLAKEDLKFIIDSAITVVSLAAKVL